MSSEGNVALMRTALL